MRIIRTICILLLGVVIGTLLLYVLGWRRPVPSVWVIDPSLDPTSEGSSFPALKQGQVIKWRSVPNGKAFAVVFPHNGPCGSKPIKSTDKEELGVHIATCKVESVDSTKSYSYKIILASRLKDYLKFLTQFPCPGCQFYPTNPPDSVKKTSQVTMKISPLNTVGVGCDSAAQVLDLTKPIVPTDKNKSAAWNLDGDSTKYFTLDFGAEYGTNVHCTSDVTQAQGVTKASCSFTASKDYTYYAKDVTTGTVCTTRAEGTVHVP